MHDGDTMQPRGFWQSFGLFAVTTGLPFGVLMSLWFSLVLTGFDLFRFLSVALLSGGLFGILFGATMAVLMGSCTVTLPARDPDRFAQALQAALRRIGYGEPLVDGNRTTFLPGFKAGFLAPPVQVRVDAGEATVIGPWIHVRSLVKRMRG